MARGVKSYGALLLVLMASLAFAEEYRISIKTGCVNDAGTDANVNLVVWGRNGNAVTFNNLDNPNKDDFEKCNLDTFVRTSSQVVDPCRIRLSHDNTGNKPGWYVGYVDVARTNGSARRFNINRWLALDENPHSTSVDVNSC